MSNPPPIPPPQVTEALCPRCGKPLPPMAPYCPHCGVPPPGSRARQPMPAWKVLLIIFGVICGLGVLAIGACFVMLSGMG